MALRARLDCLTKACDIIHMIVFSPKYQSDGSIACLPCLSDVFILWEIKNFHTKFGNNIKKLNIILAMCSMDQMDM